jgi:eukaryotic-like serine/threonine-protein kinase
VSAGAPGPDDARHGAGAGRVGQRFGAYTVTRLIGRGTSGSVYLAQDPRHHTWVALKVLNQAAGSDRAHHVAAQRRFLAEAATAQRLRHPDIVAVLDAGETAGSWWLAMELVPGTDLTRYTAPARLLPPALVLQVGQRVATALAHAHGQGFVHRDVKPSNLLVHWPSQTLKLGDFGVARGLDTQATATGVVLGTPVYLAPEQLAGAQAEPRTDLYALGVTLFQLWCGRLPFEADTMGGLLHAVATQPAPSLRQLRPELPEAVAELVASLLRKSAHERPSDAAQVAAALAAVRSHAPEV